MGSYFSILYDILTGEKDRQQQIDFILRQYRWDSDNETETGYEYFDSEIR